MDKPERLLLIDDDETFARVLARALGARGFQVSVAHDAATALSLLRREHPSHAVLDLKLGADNGLTLIPQLLAIAPQLRILLLTGYASIARSCGISVRPLSAPSLRSSTACVGCSRRSSASAPAAS
ncbi:MAG TPA: response regulator [Tahibacter sp.]|nr:response regulator [Tahibacter sp.]